jgi:hypothetical protein
MTRMALASFVSAAALACPTIPGTKPKDDVDGFIFDPGTGTHSRPATSDQQQRDATANAQLQSFPFNANPSDTSTATAPDPAALTIGQRRTFDGASVNGRGITGTKKRTGTWECIDLTGPRFQLVSADGTRLIPRKTFTPSADDLTNSRPA